MWWLIVPGSFLILIFAYLLFAPFFLEVDSGSGLYLVRFHRLFSARLSFKENSVFADLRIAWWKKQIDLLETKSSEKQTEVKKDKKEARRISFRKMLGIIRSFRIKKLFVDWDTGDIPLNGLLFPFFLLLSAKSGKHININFKGENKLILKLENNLARIIWAFIKTKN